MSERLAISAALSVLMMSAYVLFGTDTARMPFVGKTLVPGISMPAPEVSLNAGKLLPLVR